MQARKLRVCKVLNDIIQAADPEKPYTYKMLEDETGVDRVVEAHKILGEISEEHFQETGLLVSSLIVNQETGHPGAGYFRLAQELGLFPENESAGEKIDRTWYPSAKAAEFWRAQRDAIYLRKPHIRVLET